MTLRFLRPPALANVERVRNDVEVLRDDHVAPASQRLPTHPSTDRQFWTP
jgi:hypothetical protein